MGLMQPTDRDRVIKLIRSATEVLTSAAWNPAGHYGARLGDDGNHPRLDGRPNRGDGPQRKPRRHGPRCGFGLAGPIPTRSIQAYTISQDEKRLRENRFLARFAPASVALSVVLSQHPFDVLNRRAGTGRKCPEDVGVAA